MADGSITLDVGFNESSMKKGINSIKGMLKGLAVAGGAMAVAITKKAVDAYADYEQLVGGVETLFKKSAKDVQKYASQAYKRQGMSANQYMETVTSFSASLLKSLKGNTKEAAKMADMAVTDMSDNANKMGTDVSMIQSAYQRICKAKLYITR